MPDRDDKIPKLDDLLSHRTPNRILEVNRIGAEFELIRRAFVDKGKAPPSAKDFRRAGAASGTHLLRLISSRASKGQPVARIISPSANRHPELYPSLNPNEGLPYQCAKLVFRPLEVAGRSTRTLADHILNPDEQLSPEVTKAFAKAFGEDALGALRDGLTTPLDAITSLPAAEFPIIYLPRPGGGDLQATPLAPAESYVRFAEVTEPYFREQEEGQPRVPRGRWHRQYVADKPQNISSAVGKQRTRFLASMPDVLDRMSAELHRFASGGRFPQWRDDGVVTAVEGYANLLDRSKDFSNADIRAGLDQRADQLIRAARDFIDETMAAAAEAFPDKTLPAPPSIVSVIRRRRWPTKDDQDRARRVLTDHHFKGQLNAAGKN